MAPSSPTLLLLCTGMVAAVVAFGSHAVLASHTLWHRSAQRLRVSALAGYCVGIVLLGAFVLHSLG